MDCPTAQNRSDYASDGLSDEFVSHAILCRNADRNRVCCTRPSVGRRARISTTRLLEPRLVGPVKTTPPDLRSFQDKAPPLLCDGALGAAGPRWLGWVRNARWQSATSICARGCVSLPGRAFALGVAATTHKKSPDRKVAGAWSFREV